MGLRDVKTCYKIKIGGCKRVKKADVCYFFSFLNHLAAPQIYIVMSQTADLHNHEKRPTRKSHLKCLFSASAMF